MRQLNTYHSGMAGYLMDFGFGGFDGCTGCCVRRIGDGRTEWKENV